MKPIGLLLAMALLWGCAPKAQTIPGTQIPDNQINRDIIDVVEQYRLAVERKDTSALLVMASKQYWEDAGTPTGSDDYGYDGLREVLSTRFQQASDIRYSLRYMGIQRKCKPGGVAETNEGCRAYVDVLIDGSFTMVNAYGQKVRPDMRDQNQLVLEWEPEASRWLFLSGM
ncbi:hypothetical protein [Haliangium sp.]|uniref:hypothetical protein n=1 Tax=Haliangium sp. TaxID=2663208 RepID=UPI003D1520C1